MSSHRTPFLLLVMLALLAAVLMPFEDLYNLLIVSEFGIVETGTALLSLFGAVLAWSLFRHRDRLPARWIGWWYLCFAVGLVFLAGEEVSWGQHWVGWETSPEYAAKNIQGETNLHNLFNWTEQIPKIALGSAVFLTGIAWPLYARFARPSFPARSGWMSWIWPPAHLWPSAAIAFGIRLAERIPVWIDADPDSARHHLKALKEANELFLILFVVLYLHHAWCRLRREG